MNSQKIFKIISIVAYLLIILMGDMIGLPFFIWLLFTLFDFGNEDQFFAGLAVIGLSVTFFKMNSTRNLKIVLIDIASFALMAAPIVHRLTTIPIEKFNYLAFIIPLTIFALFYFLSIYLSVNIGNRIIFPISAIKIRLLIGVFDTIFA